MRETKMEEDASHLQQGLLQKQAARLCLRNHRHPQATGFKLTSLAAGLYFLQFFWYFNAK